MMEIEEAIVRLSNVMAPPGAAIRGVRLRTDDDLGELVADVLWLVPAPRRGTRWVLTDLNELCVLAAQALGGAVSSVYCRYRTKEELESTEEQDFQYFAEVRVAA